MRQPLNSSLFSASVSGRDPLVTAQLLRYATAFKTEEDVEAFQSSAWAQERKERYNERVGGEPTVGRFEVAQFPEGASHKAFTQFSSIVIDDKSKHPEVRKAWMSLVDALGKETWGGVSVGDGPTVGLGLVGWDSLEVRQCYF